MNEMRARLVVSADTAQVVGAMRQAEAALDGVSSSAARLGAGLGKAGASSKTALRDLIDSATGVDRSMSSAGKSADVFSRALAEQEARFKGLRAAIDPAWRAEQQFKAAQTEINRALKAGIVDGRGHADMMARLTGQYQRAVDEARKLDAMQTGVGQSMGSVRGQIQNAAFQFGDLATQIGAGTSASVALGQQLPQLLGGLGVWGAVAGAAVAVGVPLASAFLGAGDAAKEAENQLQVLDATISQLSDRLDILNDKRLGDTFGSMTVSVRELTRAMLELDRSAQLKALSDTLDGTVDRTIGRASMSWWTRPIWENEQQTGMLERANYARLTSSKGLSFDDFQTRRQEIGLLAQTGQVEQVGVKVNQLIKDMADGGPITQLNDELRVMLTTMGDIAIRAAEVEGKYNGTADKAKAYNDVLDEAMGRQNDLARLAGVRADAEDRLAAATAARDASAQAAARAVIAETDRQIAATTDAKARVDALGTSFSDIERVASVVAFDKGGKFRAALDLAKTDLVAAQQNVEKLNDTELTRIENAFARLAKAARAMATATTGIGGAFGGLDVSGYADALSASRAVIQKYESWAPVAKWDENANRGGWGSSTVTLADGTQRKLQAGETVNKADADRDLDRRIRGYFDEQRRVAGQAWSGFTPAQVAAIASIQHNYGSIPKRIQPALQTGDAQLIAQAIAGLAMDYTRSERAAGKTGRPMNYNRRMGEAAAFGDPAGIREANDAAISAREEAAREAKRNADEAARRAKADADRAAREAKSRADQDQRTRDSVTAELDKLTPSYERAVAAADRWKAEALAGLDKTKAGYEAFAADIERVYQQQIDKAREDDLGRQKAWAAGVERGLDELRENTLSWAQMSEDLVTGWAKGGEDAFVNFVKTGKASLEELADFTLEQLARMAWQQAIQPGLNGLLQSAANALGGALGVAPSASPGVTLPTAHTGGRGVMRTYSAGNRRRADERLAMLRDGEKVMTPRMLENAGALVSSLAGMAGRDGDRQVVDARPVIQVINNSSAPVTGEVRETDDGRGGRQYQMVLSDAVAGALAAPGGQAGRTLQQRFNVTQRGVRR